MRSSDCLSDRLIYLAVLLSIAILLASCGGSGTTELTSSGPPPATPDFSISVQDSSLALEVAGVSQGQLIGVDGSNGFNSNVTLTLTLPAGVFSIPAGPLSLVPGQGQSISLFASSSAIAGNATVTITGTSGSLTHNASFTLTISPAASFQVTVSPSKLTLQPGSIASATVSLTSTSSVPAGVIFNVPFISPNTGLDIEEPGLSTTATQFTITVSASAAVQPLQSYPIFISAGNGTQSSQAALLISTTSSFPPITSLTRSTFASTDMGITGVVYDRARKLVFATAWQLNEVLVYSSLDGSLKATIPLTQAFGIDESADGTKVYVGSLSPNVAVINPDLLQVTDVVYNVLPPVQLEINDASRLVALSNGKALITGPSIYLWDPGTGTINQSNVGSFSGFGMVARTVDHSKAAVSEGNGGSRMLIYDANADSFAVLTASDSNPNIATFALNSDGSQVATVSADGQGISFYDSDLQLQKTVPLAPGENRAAALLTYSLDGQKLYALSSLEGLPEATVIDANTFSIVGVAPNPTGAQMLLSAIDETGMIFIGTDNGLGFFDASDPGFVKLPFPSLAGGLTPELLSETTPTSTSISGVGFNSADQYQVYFGNPPASPQSQPGSATTFVSSSTLQTVAPAGLPPGAANVTLTKSDGWAQIEPNAVTYGPQILRIEGNAGPPQGGAIAVIYGYGLSASNTQVQIGGVSASVSQFIPPGDGSPGPPVDLVYINVPPGHPGPADVTVTTPDGTDTLAGGYQYLASTDVYPLAGALNQILYDQKRQQLYVSNTDHNQVNIFSLTSNTFLQPIAVGNQPLGMAFTPDLSDLAVVNSADGTVSVVNLNSNAVIATDSVLTSSDKASPCQGEPYELTAAGAQGMIVAVNCTGLLDNGVVHFLNLASGSLNCSGIPSCDPSGSNNLQLGTDLKALASSPDANLVAVADFAGQVSLLNLQNNKLLQGGIGVGDVAVDADGNRIASAFTPGELGAVYDSQLNLIAVPQDILYLDASAESPGTVIGEKLNPSGSLLYSPQAPLFASTRGVDIFDVHRERLTLRVALPDPIAGALNSLALDETGTKMFVISQTGITVAQLSAAPLSIGTLTPPIAAIGTLVTIRGSGFTPNSEVSFGSIAAPTTFVDQNTLRATVPSLASGPVRVTVSNSNSVSYSFDAAFTVQ